MNKFSQRLSSFIAAIGETTTSFENKIGVSKGTIQKAITKGKTVGVNTLVKIFSKYPLLDAEWLIIGNGQMMKTALTAADPAHDHPWSSMKTEDPEVGYIAFKGPKTAVSLINIKMAAGWDGSPDHQNDAIELVFHLPSRILPKGRSYAAFPIAGDSMEPAVAAKSLVIADLVKPKDYLRIQNNQLYVIITAEGVTLRRLTNRLKESGVLYAFSDNREYTPHEIPENEIISLWKARALFSSRLTNEPRSLYRLYQDLEERIKLLEVTNTRVNTDRQSTADSY